MRTLNCESQRQCTLCCEALGFNDCPLVRSLVLREAVFYEDGLRPWVLCGALCYEDGSKVRALNCASRRQCTLCCEALGYKDCSLARSLVLREAVFYEDGSLVHALVLCEALCDEDALLVHNRELCVQRQFTLHCYEGGSFLQPFCYEN